jgi:hypothetical protein
MPKANFYILALFFCLSADAYSQAVQSSGAMPRNVKFKDHATVSKANKSPEAATDTRFSGNTAESEMLIPAQSAELNNLRSNYLDNDGLILSNEQRSLEQLAKTYEGASHSEYEAAYALLRVYRNSAIGGKYLNRATALKPTDARLQLEAAWIAERMNKISERNAAASMAQKSGLISQTLVQQAEWLLQAAGKNGIIITNGENDTYPFWISPNANNCTVISLQFINEADYINRKLSEAGIKSELQTYADPSDLLLLLKNSGKSVVLNWTIHPDILKKWQHNLYAVGPGLILSKNSVNNISLLRQFYLNKSNGKKIKSEIWVNDPFAATMANLIPGITVLLNSGSLSDSDKKSVLSLYNELVSNLKKAGVHGR